MDDEKEPVPAVKTRPYVTPAGVPGWAATFEMHGIALLDELDRGDLSLPRERAAKHTLRAAGLRAAVHFKADILPFLSLGERISSSGDNVGVVTLISRSPGDEYVVLDWGTGEQTRLHPAELARRLRNGGWTFPGG